MKDLIANFGSQLIEATNIGEKTVLSSNSETIYNVVIAGMGGSGIGATIAADVVRDQAALPVVVVKGYFVPTFVNEHSLVIVSSYSGTTEEAVQFLKTSREKGAHIVCITTGGEIGEIAKKEKIDLIEVPAGISPRAGLGYSLIQILFILHRYGIINDAFKQELVASSKLLEKEESAVQKEALEIAQVLQGKIPVIYTSLESEGVAIRFRQQLNENAKMLGWSAVLPEMNHNELVGWTQKNEKLAVVFFRNTHEYKRIAKRIEITKEVVAKYTPYVIEIKAKGVSFLEQTLYQIHIGDWISYYLSELIGCDPIEVRVVDYLKGEMNNPQRN